VHDLMEAAGLAAQCFGFAKEFLESDLDTRAACLIVDIPHAEDVGPSVAGQVERRGMQYFDTHKPWAGSGGACVRIERIIGNSAALE
jgi:hypothetical protein